MEEKGHAVDQRFDQRICHNSLIYVSFQYVTDTLRNISSPPPIITDFGATKGANSGSERLLIPQASFFEGRSQTFGGATRVRAAT
jgi:hypothetical protein